jgi:VWFA-related protein
MSCTRLFLLGLAISVLNPLSGQDDFVIKDNVNLVLLDVSVKDSHTGYVTDLQKSDFRVLENGKPRPITQFENIDAPVSVGLVVDNSASMRSKKNEVLQAGLAFAHESNPQDEFFVVNFNNWVSSGLPSQLPFTDSLSVLQKALHYGMPAGQTALYDAVSYSLRHLQLAHHEQRTLIVVSDGGDNVSKISLADLLNQIQLSRATIYTVGLVDPDNRDLNPSILRKIAATSGGGYYQPPKLEDVAIVLAQIARDIRHRYTVGFTPDEEHDNRPVRSVKVIAERAGEHLSCRSRSTFRIPAIAGKA